MCRHQRASLTPMLLKVIAQRRTCSSFSCAPIVATDMGRW
jgi:hypothetical protein